jgi:hypothetical protein
MLEVWFDQDVDKISAEDVANYRIVPLDGGTDVSVTSAEMIRRGERVRLLTSEHQPGARYRLDVSGVHDQFLTEVLVDDSQEYVVLQNLLQNPGAEEGILQWLSESGFMSVSDRENQLPYSGNAFFTGQDLQPYSGAVQEIDLADRADEIDASQVRAVWHCYFTTGYETLGEIQASRCEPYDEAEMLIDFVDAEDRLLLQASSKRWDTLFWHPYGEASYLPPGTRKARVHLNSYRKTANGLSNDAAFDNAFFAVQALDTAHPYGSNLLQNASAESGLTGWNVTGEMQTLANEVQKTRSVSGGNVFANISASKAIATQSIEMSEYSGFIDSGELFLRWGGWMRDFRGDEYGEISLEFLDGNKEQIAVVSTGQQRVAEWWYYDSVSVVPPGTDKVNFRISGVAYFDFLHLIPAFDMITDVASQDVAIREFNLRQNYPNPFNPATTIEYEVVTRSDVSITIYNAQGQIVDKLVSAESHLPGEYKVRWHARNSASGLYFYRLRAGDYSITRKMLLLR